MCPIKYAHKTLNPNNDPFSKILKIDCTGSEKAVKFGIFQQQNKHSLSLANRTIFNIYDN